MRCSQRGVLEIHADDPTAPWPSYRRGRLDGEALTLTAAFLTQRLKALATGPGCVAEG
jgi:hypothetical protein